MRVSKKSGVGKCLLASVALCLALPGCNGAVRDVETQLERESAALEASMEGFHARPEIRPSGAQISDGVFVAVEADRTETGLRLPKRLQRENAVYLVGAEPLRPNEILARLTAITGVPHVLLLGPGGALANSGAGGLDSPVSGSPEAPVPVGSTVQLISAVPNYKGSLSTVLDRISGEFDLAWSYDHDRVVLREFVFRQYQLSVLPVRSEYSGSVGSATSSLAADVSEEVLHALKGIAGDSATVHFAESAGIISAVARPKDHVRLAEYVRQLNESAGRQVAFDVNVISVSLNRSESFGLDLELIVGRENSSRVNLSGGTSVAEASDTVNARIVRGAIDLEAVVGALSRKGDVSVETRIGTTTSNNRMVPIQVVRETAYAKKIASVPDALGNTRTTIEPGTVTSGFEIHLLPRVLNNQEVLVRYTIKMSDLNDLAEFTSDRQTIQLPKVSTTSFEQETMLQNGHTLVLAGFERDRKSVDQPGSRYGLGGGMLGGKSASNLERTSTVLLIRPRILSRDAGRLATIVGNPSDVRGGSS